LRGGREVPTQCARTAVRWLRGTVMPQKSMTEVAGFPSGVIMALLREGLIVVRLELRDTAGHTAMIPMVKITAAGRQVVARSSDT